MILPNSKYIFERGGEKVYLTVTLAHIHAAEEIPHGLANAIKYKQLADTGMPWSPDWERKIRRAAELLERKKDRVFGSCPDGIFWATNLDEAIYGTKGKLATARGTIRQANRRRKLAKKLFVGAA
jgi:hypothetical protein